MKEIFIVILLSTSAAVFYYQHYASLSERSASSSHKNDHAAGKVIKAGLFKVVRSNGLVDSKNTSTGKAISKPVIQMVKTGDRIPLIKDAHMSLQYRIWNLPEQPAYIKLRRVLKHPPMTLPDGTVTTGSAYMINSHVSIGQVIAYTGYGLNEDYEMVEGDWTFQIWRDDEKLIEQTFTTYVPDADETRLLGDLSPPVRSNTVTAPVINDSAVVKKTGNAQAAAKRNWIK